MIRPLPDFASSGSASLIRRNGALTLTAQSSSSTASSPSLKLSGFMMPALLMRASRRPKRLSVSSSHACAEAGSSASKCETSSRFGSAAPNLPCTSAGRRTPSDRLNPSAARRCAIAAPMPREAPEIITTRPAGLSRSGSLTSERPPEAADDVPELLALGGDLGLVAADQHGGGQQLRVVAGGAGLGVSAGVEEADVVAALQRRHLSIRSHLVGIAERTHEVDHLGRGRARVHHRYRVVVPVEHRGPGKVVGREIHVDPLLLR